MAKLIQARIVNLGFVLALVILCLVGALSINQSRQLANANHWVAHTHQVIETLANLQADIRNAEFQQRTYLLSGNPAALKQYQQAMQSVWRDFRSIQQLTRDNAIQQQRLNGLAATINGRLALLNRAIGVSLRQGLAAASTFIDTSNAQNLTQQIGQTITDASRMERHLLDARNTAALETAHESNTIMLVGFILSLASLGWGFFIFGQQNVARAKAEAARQELETHFALMVDSVKDYAILMLDKDGHVTSWNEGAERIKGYAEHEVLGEHYAKFFPAEAIARGEPEYALKYAAAHGVFKQEALRVRKDGSLFWADITLTAIQDDKGQLEGYAKVTRDITERKLIEDTLRERETRLQAVMDHVADAIVTIDERSVIESFNPAAERMFGYAPEEIIGQRLEVLMPEEYRQNHQGYIDRYTGAGKGHMRRTFQGVRKDGDTFPIDIAVSPMQLENGRKIIGLIRDITEQKKAEEAIKSGQARLQSVMDNVADGIVVIDENSMIETFNPAASDIFGYRPEDVIGKPLAMLMPQQYHAKHDAYVEHYKQTGRSQALGIGPRAMQGQRQSGEVFPLDVAISEMVVEGRRLFIGIVRDVTERRKAEEALQESEKRLQLAIEAANMGSFDWNIQKDEIWCDDNTLKIVCRHDIPVNSFTDLVNQAHPEDRPAVENAVRTALESGGHTTVEYRNICPKGHMRWIAGHGLATKDAAGKCARMFGMVQDITERKQAELQIKESEAKFRATFEHAPVGIMETEPGGRVQRVNRTLCEMLGYTAEEMERMNHVDYTYPADLEETVANREQLLAGKVSSYTQIKRYLRKDGSIMWGEVSLSLRREPQTHEPRYVIAIIEDITERKKAEEALKHAHEQTYYMANHDNLTGLANRAQFNDRLKDALAYAKRDGHLVALHLLDLDRFKSINDTMGHHVGDVLLKEVAERLNGLIRETDVAARLGGDEFVIIQTHLGDPNAACVLAEKIVAELGRPYRLEGQEVISGTSVGVAIYPNDAHDAEQLVKAADMAVYEAKHRGRGNYQLFTKDMSDAFQLGQKLEKDLIRALEDEEFRLHYQPQYDLGSGQMTGIEALVRWQNPDRGLVSAAEFIGPAEDAGLTLPIGEWVLRNACRQHKTWVDAGATMPMTVNVSSKQLRHPKFLKMVKRVLADTGLPPALLQLEIRENVLLDSRASLEILKELKALGVRLSLDDFGSELTALSCLHSYPIDVLKLGQKIVKVMPEKQPETATIMAILVLAKELGTQVCAEGVERMEQLTFLKRHGCQAAQGFLLSPPLAGEDMAQLLAGH